MYLNFLEAQQKMNRLKDNAKDTAETVTDKIKMSGKTMTGNVKNVGESMKKVFPPM